MANTDKSIEIITKQISSLSKIYGVGTTAIQPFLLQQKNLFIQLERTTGALQQQKNMMDMAKATVSGMTKSLLAMSAALGLVGLGIRSFLDVSKARLSLTILDPKIIQQIRGIRGSINQAQVEVLSSILGGSATSQYGIGRSPTALKGLLDVQSKLVSGGFSREMSAQILENVTHSFGSNYARQKSFMEEIGRGGNINAVINKYATSSNIRQLDSLKNALEVAGSKANDPLVQSAKDINSGMEKLKSSIEKLTDLLASSPLVQKSVEGVANHPIATAAGLAGIWYRKPITAAIMKAIGRGATGAAIGAGGEALPLIEGFGAKALPATIGAATGGGLAGLATKSLYGLAGLGYLMGGEMAVNLLRGKNLSESTLLNRKIINPIINAHYRKQLDTSALPPSKAYGSLQSKIETWARVQNNYNPEVLQRRFAELKEKYGQPDAVMQPIIKQTGNMFTNMLDKIKPFISALEKMTGTTKSASDRLETLRLAAVKSEALQLSEKQSESITGVYRNLYEISKINPLGIGNKSDFNNYLKAMETQTKILEEQLATVKGTDAESIITRNSIVEQILGLKKESKSARLDLMNQFDAVGQVINQASNAMGHFSKIYINKDRALGFGLESDMIRGLKDFAGAYGYAGYEALTARQNPKRLSDIWPSNLLPSMAESTPLKRPQKLRVDSDSSVGGQLASLGVQLMQVLKTIGVNLDQENNLNAPVGLDPSANRAGSRNGNVVG